MTILRRGRTYWWCPKGCGKSMKICALRNNRIRVWECGRCGYVFLKEELLDLNPTLGSKNKKKTGNYKLRKTSTYKNAHRERYLRLKNSPNLIKELSLKID